MSLLPMSFRLESKETTSLCLGEHFKPSVPDDIIRFLRMIIGSTHPNHSSVIQTHCSDTANTEAMIPAYSVSAIRLAFDDISTVLPVANRLAALLIPFLVNLLNNLNNLSNIVQNLTPALLPYFRCTLPLLYATLTDLASVLFLYISVLISLFRTNVLAAPGVLTGLVTQILNLVTGLLGSLTDDSGLIGSLVKSITNVVVQLENILI
ncbi:hypothetical protein EVAR_100291_1 [Eumeta japonica]|uniref:Uncharacterized protein n=1 Tax=Eumeta variegata TaxID=151549 RepID=A0A4C2A2Y8_EUMVA|nr:hypothetical protein EVAR_100291_1 [Eumeta japonica]